MKAQYDLKVGQMQVRVRERSRQELSVEAQCDQWMEAVQVWEQAQCDLKVGQIWVRVGERSRLELLVEV